MSGVVPFDEYMSTLGRITPHADPLMPTAESNAIRAATESLESLNAINHSTLTRWIETHPKDVPVLGLIVGLGQEKLKNSLKDRFNTTGWFTLASNHADELIKWLDSDFDLVHLANEQAHRPYALSDVLVARAGSRATATAAGKSGRQVEDVIESVAHRLGLPYQTRTRFEGRNGRTAPCDLVIPNGFGAEIVVAAKGFDSTGSKLTDSVREIEEMADVRTPNQFVLAVIDGIGWKSRVADLRRIHQLWEKKYIDGMYTLQTMHHFESDVEHAARLRNLL